MNEPTLTDSPLSGGPHLGHLPNSSVPQGADGGSASSSAGSSTGGDGCCYLCNQCTSSFPSLEELEAHLATHNNDSSSSNNNNNNSQNNNEDLTMDSNNADGDGDGAGGDGEDADDLPHGRVGQENSPSSSDTSFPMEEGGPQEGSLGIDVDDIESHHGHPSSNGAHSGMSSNGPGSGVMMSLGDLPPGYDLAMEGSGGRGQAAFTCRFCHKLFENRSLLNIHYTHTHRDKPQYECEDCGRIFSVKRELATHRRVHSGEQTHACAQCGKEFGTRQLLKKHWMWHTGQRSHVCPHCGKAFFQKGHLTQHLMIHAGGRPHVCQLCNKTFIFKFDLNRHMKIHAERGYSCVKCGKAFLKEASLVDHQAKCDGTTSSSPALSLTGGLKEESHSANGSPSLISMSKSPMLPKSAGSSMSAPSTPDKKLDLPTGISGLFPSPLGSGGVQLPGAPPHTPTSILGAAQSINNAVNSVVQAAAAANNNSSNNPTMIMNSAPNTPNNGAATNNNNNNNSNSNGSNGPQRFLCLLCMQDFPSQAAYSLHLSYVHLRDAMFSSLNNGGGSSPSPTTPNSALHHQNGISPIPNMAGMGAVGGLAMDLQQQQQQQQTVAIMNSIRAAAAEGLTIPTNLTAMAAGGGINLPSLMKTSNGGGLAMPNPHLIGNGGGGPSLMSSMPNPQQYQHQNGTGPTSAALSINASTSSSSNGVIVTGPASSSSKSAVAIFNNKQENRRENGHNKSSTKGRNNGDEMTMTDDGGGGGNDSVSNNNHLRKDNRMGDNQNDDDGDDGGGQEEQTEAGGEEQERRQQQQQQQLLMDEIKKEDLAEIALNGCIDGCKGCSQVGSRLLMTLQRMRDLERESGEKDAEMGRMKEKMKCVALIASGLLESCSEFDKLWILHSKKVYNQIQSVINSLD